MYGTVDKQVEIYKVHLKSDAIDDFEMELPCIKAEKPVLIYLPNPRISELKLKNSRIRRLVFNEEAATAEKLPVHVILGAADIQRMKSTEPAVLGSNPDTDPGAKFPMLRWVIAGRSILPNTGVEKGIFLNSSQDEFVQMCSQEVLGLTDVAESTKKRIVYDYSAKPDSQAQSLDDCLKVGHPLQPMIFAILLRNRLNFLCITDDIQKAFLQIKVDPKDRDALRLLWYENLNSRTVLQYRFTRVIFGSGPSPYILGATLQKHVSQYADKYPTTTVELLKITYVDDMQSGGGQKEELLKLKEESSKIMKEGGFLLHKWHSNIPEVEAPLR
ncbi:hypothetical protein AWC38_SpisGene19665 [Stylophora pistillata]|uniref:Reverse transcriptase domain-containing protein n=1 Tax=Stylophora pistillata TaxID=50429 RepID=A0A2B4RI90_STYPI|nr:hypothetical protein AWC38_SpisGene19665 [Stylophora pistillata]